MWAILEIIILAVVILVSITEFFIPLITGKPYFGSFRKENIIHNKKTDESPLISKITEAKEKVKDVKQVQEAVTENFKSAAQLKEEADNLLK